MIINELIYHHTSRVFIFLFFSENIFVHIICKKYIITNCTLRCFPTDQKKKTKKNILQKLSKNVFFQFSTSPHHLPLVLVLVPLRERHSLSSSSYYLIRVTHTILIFVSFFYKKISSRSVGGGINLFLYGDVCSFL